MDKARVPEVAVRVKAPVVWVKPAEAVNNPAEVMVPVPVVLILARVDRVPASVMVKVGEPPDLTERAVLVAPLVSFMTRVFAVPALVRLKDVWAVRPEPKVKSIFLPSVVVMVLPPV